MFLMMAEVLAIPKVAKKSFPDSPVWQALAFHNSHVEWTGCSLHDLIQPSFSFLVGVSLPFSLAARRAKGQSSGRMTLHALWRSVVLIFLGVFLRSVGHRQTRWTFEDTLSQIGLGYFFLYLLGLARPRVQAAALVLILVGYWAAFALHPQPGPDFDPAAVNVSREWYEAHKLDGFAAHWNNNTNPAWAFDHWLLNWLPREKPFLGNSDGYSTLSFIPTLGTMILGLLAGGWLLADGPPGRKLLRLLAAAAVCLAAGYALDHFGVCPSVKKIWTPAWVLVSGGWSFLMLAGFFTVLEMAGLRAWAYPLVVIGRNSIAAYVMVHLMNDFLLKSLRTHLGQDVFKNVLTWLRDRLGPDVFRADVATYEPLLAGAALLLIYWLILFWMDRRRIYLKI
jgi:predicted acyltransferase